MVRVDTHLAVPIEHVAGRAREFEEAGFDGVFTFEGPDDPFLPLAVAASCTDLAIYPNVALAFPRSPLTHAYQAWHLQRLSGGRFILGLGTQVKANIERRYGVPFSPPVARLEEMVLAIKAIFRAWQDGERLSFEGEYYRHTLMQPTFNPGPNPHGVPPVLLGALGPRMTALAVGVADGLFLHPFNTARHIQEHSLPAIKAGLAAARRTRKDITLVCDVIVAAGRDERELALADEGTRRLLSFYASTPAYRPPLDTEGWGEVQPELNRMSKEGRWDEMTGLIDDEMLQTLAVRGHPKDVAQQVRARFGDLPDRVAFYLPYQFAPDLAAEVLDALRD